MHVYLADSYTRHLEGGLRTLGIWLPEYKSQGPGRNFGSHPLAKTGPAIICKSTQGKNTTMSDICIYTTYILSS